MGKNNINIIEITEPEWTEQKGLSSRGKRVKAWYENDGNTYLLKEPECFKDHNFITLEIWTEIIAYYLGQRLGVDVPKAMPVKYKENDKILYGVLIENFLKKIKFAPIKGIWMPDLKEDLIHGQEILRQFDKNDYHNLEYIKTLMILIGKKKNDIYWKKFKQMLIFDCLIGNNDRHDENWGICLDLETGTYRLAPAYDNANCLTARYLDRNVERLLIDDKYRDKYIKGSKPFIRLNVKDNKRYNYYKMMQYLLEQEDDMKSLINEMLNISYDDYIGDIMDNIQLLDVPQEYKLSDDRVKAINMLLVERKKLLRELIT